MQATLSGAAARMLGTVIALWLPLVPIFLIMRHTLGSRSNLRRAAVLHCLQTPSERTSAHVLVVRVVWCRSRPARHTCHRHSPIHRLPAGTRRAATTRQLRRW